MRRVSRNNSAVRPFSFTAGLKTTPYTTACNDSCRKNSIGVLSVAVVLLDHSLSLLSLTVSDVKAKCLCWGKNGKYLKRTCWVASLTIESFGLMTGRRISKKEWYLHHFKSTRVSPELRVLKGTMTFHQEKAFYHVKVKSQTFVPSQILCVCSQWPYDSPYLQIWKSNFIVIFIRGETAFTTIMKRAAFSSNQIKQNLKTFAPKIGWGFWITCLKKGRDPGILNWGHQKFVSLAPRESEHGTLICH